MADRPGGTAADVEEVVWSARSGAHLEAARKQAGMRRIDLAYQMGVTEETIRLWEKGSVQPSVERLARLIALMSLETNSWPARSEPTGDLPPLAQRLRQEREGRGSTQAEVVRRLGVPQATYAGWETGRTTPGAHLHAILADFLGVAEQDIATLCSTPFVVDTTGWPAFGQFLGSRRQELRLTRSALAAAVGVSQGTVVAWELGHRAPGATQLPKLAAALSVDVASLVAALPRRPVSSVLGDLILTRQRALGLRSTDVAQLTGATEATVSRWVQGRSRPGPRYIERLATVLGVPVATVQAAAVS